MPSHVLENWGTHVRNNNIYKTTRIYLNKLWNRKLIIYFIENFVYFFLQTLFYFKQNRIKVLQDTYSKRMFPINAFTGKFIVSACYSLI